MSARSAFRRVLEEIRVALFALPCVLGIHSRHGVECRWHRSRESRRGIAC